MTKISALRQRFIADMNLAGLAAGTQSIDIGLILKFVRSCGNSTLAHVSQPSLTAPFQANVLPSKHCSPVLSDGNGTSLLKTSRMPQTLSTARCRH